jgi:flagellar motility protein MotE (MotC chaperone)
MPAEIKKWWDYFNRKPGAVVLILLSIVLTFVAVTNAQAYIESIAKAPYEKLSSEISKVAANQDSQYMELQLVKQASELRDQNVKDIKEDVKTVLVEIRDMRKELGNKQDRR